MRHIKTKILSFLALSFLLAHSVRAGLFRDDVAEKIKGRGDSFGEGVGFASEQTPGKTIAFLIEAFLGLLGIIFIIIIIVAGVRWMIAGGDEEKVRKSRSMITRSIIGLLIVIAAYSITFFVFNHLPMGDAGPT